jgi:hypothetical protein
MAAFVTLRSALCASLLGLCSLAQAAHDAADPARAEPRRVALADARMASTEGARNTLKYMANCALDAQTVLSAEHEGVTYEFPGGVGLAPQWHKRPMTEEEQRWVSACMLARTNRFGARVEISMRAPFPSNLDFLDKPQPEDAAFEQEEGSFFGNLFAEQPVGYVCGPAHDAAARARIQAQRRVCALEPQAQDGAPAGGRFTACGMQHVGRCTGAAFEQGGTRYRQAMTIFLK